MEIIICILISSLFIICFSFSEVYLDKKISSSIDLDGIRTKLENKLLHGDQMLWRSVSFVTSCLSGWAVSEIRFLEMFIFTPFLVIVYWWSIDLISNLWWLKKPWYYEGTTAKTDSKKYIIYWKIGLFIISLIIGIVLLHLTYKYK